MSVSSNRTLEQELDWPLILVQVVADMSADTLSILGAALWSCKTANEARAVLKGTVSRAYLEWRER